MGMKLTVLSSVHHFVVTNGFNVVAFKCSSREQAHLFYFIFSYMFLCEFTLRYAHVVLIGLSFNNFLIFRAKYEVR